jgi:hypothetical protein
MFFFLALYLSKFIERKIFLFQSEVVFLISKNKFRSVRKMQKIIIRSFFCKLKVIRDVSFHLQNLNYIDQSFVFDSSKKIELLFSLRKQLFYKDDFKDNYFLSYTCFYNNCYRDLLTLFLMPISESFIGRFSHGFQPYRDSYDFIISLKRFFNNSSINFSWYLNFNMFSFYFNYSLLRSSLISIKFSNFLINNNSSSNNIANILINCLFNGLVWFIFIKFILYFLQFK